MSKDTKRGLIASNILPPEQDRQKNLPDPTQSVKPSACKNERAS